MKEKIIKGLIYFTGAVCLYLFLAVRIESLFNLIIKEKVLPEYWENTKYGELYYVNNYIKYFQEKNLPHYQIKYRFTKKHPKLDKADIITFGDSFFDFSRMVTFPEALGDTMHEKVYYHRMLTDHMPIPVLEMDKFSNTKPKLFIYETSEQYLAFRFLNKHDSIYYPDTRSKLRKTIAAIRDFIFYKNSEPNYTVLLQRSYLTTGLYSDIATFKFDAFNYITEYTPLYTLKYNTPWLFYYSQVNNENTSFYYKFTDEEINRICDHIADVSAKLKKDYNLDFVFLPVPSKYTIYHTLINNDAYSDFLPRIYEGLDKRGIPVVKLYDVFRNSKDILYYGTDTHWNKKGEQIALDETLKVLSENFPELYFNNSLSNKFANSHSKSIK